MAAEIYRWTDARPVQLRPAPPPDPETAHRRKQANKLLRAMDQDGAQRARYLYTQENGQPRHILSDTERTTALRQMPAGVAKYCD